MNRTSRFSCIHLYGKGILTFLLVIPWLINSCISQRDLEYIRKDTKTPIAFDEAKYADYLLRPNDALYIKISSVDDASSNIFAQADEMTGSIDPYSAYLNSYTIDREGFVQLPVIGMIKASGKTTMQVSQIIKDSVENILSMPVVTVKLVNQYVSILGEVNNPGHFVFSQDKFTIFNALGMAGDITPYGDRKHVIITRNEFGKTTKRSFDLTNPNILSSDYYYIQPNDLIYIKPMRKRIWGVEEFPFSLIMSTITTGLVIYTFINQQ